MNVVVYVGNRASREVSVLDLQFILFFLFFFILNQFLSFCNFDTNVWLSVLYLLESSTCTSVLGILLVMNDVAALLIIYNLGLTK